MGMFNFIRREKDLKGKDHSLMSSLCNQSWVRDDFKSIEILNKTCLHKEINGNEVILVKIKNGRVQLGKLVDFYAKDKKTPGIKVDFGNLEGIEKGKEVVGFEPGYFFIEREFSDSFNWREVYKSLKEWENEFRQRADREWFRSISLEEFIEFSKTKISEKYF